jgi:hypothetical protein
VLCTSFATLPAKLILEAPGVQRGDQCDAEAGGQSDAQNLPDPTLGHPVHFGDRGLLLDERAAVQRLGLFG